MKIYTIQCLILLCPPFLYICRAHKEWNQFSVIYKSQKPTTTTMSRVQLERKWLENRRKQHYTYNWTIAVFPSGSCYLYGEKNYNLKWAQNLNNSLCTLHFTSEKNKKSIICASLSKRQSSTCIWLYAWLSDLVRKASPNKIIKRKVRHHDCVKSIHSYTVYHFLYLCYVFLLFTPKSITAV